MLDLHGIQHSTIRLAWVRLLNGRRVLDSSCLGNRMGGLRILEDGEWGGEMTTSLKERLEEVEMKVESATQKLLITLFRIQRNH